MKKQVKVGEQVVLECLSNGTPKPKIKWTKDGIPLTASNRYHFTTEDQLLIIMETNTDDSGTYQCKINNSLGIKIQETEVLILPCKFFFNLILIFSNLHSPMIIIDVVGLLLNNYKNIT